MLLRGRWSGYGGLGALVGMICVLCVSFFTAFLSVPAGARAESFGMAWGFNLGGELGDGLDWESTMYDSDVPIGVCALNSPEKPCPTGPYLGEVVSMSAGPGHSLAVLSGGRVTGWGGNQQGSLGINTSGFTDVPFSESFTSGVSAVTTGYRFSLALLTNGTVDAFGTNTVGQLGLGHSGEERHWEPTQVVGLSGVTKVAAGGSHSLALLSNGKVMAWGRNLSGELGNGTTTSSDLPVEVSGLSEVVAVSAGENFSLALMSNGTVKAWGANNVGQLGNGTTTNSDVPVTVSGLSEVTEISAGENFSLARLSTGTASSWGENEVGQLGDGTNTGPSVCEETPEPGSGHACSTTPATVNSLSGVIAVSAGSGGAALLSNRTVWDWGGNNAGDLGDGTFTGPQGCETRTHITEQCSTTPVQALGIERVKGLSSGTGFKLAWTNETPLPTSEEMLGPENPGEPNQKRACSGDPVSCATGNLSESQIDLNIAGRGIPLELTRTYNAQAAATQSSPGPFGYGWSSSFSDHLQISSEAGTVGVVQANGSAVMFKGTPGTVGEFTAPKWGQATLSFNSEHIYVYTPPSQTVFKFNEQGRLLSETDRNGNMTSLSYTEAGLLETVTDPAGRKLTFAYSPEGRVESVKDPMGHTVKYAYESGNLVGVTLPGESSPRWRFEYDSLHRLIKMTDGRGGTTTNEYDSSNRVILQTDPASRTSTFEYAPYETSIVNRTTGEAVKEVFTEGYEPEAITRGYGSASATTERFAYNEVGELTKSTDGNGHTTQYGYDAAGNRTSMIDAENKETKWTYNGTHDMLSVTTPEGETTTIKRDSHGNPETIERPAPGSTTQTTKFTYNSAGEPESLTDPLGRIWKYEYDTQGDRTSETDPEGNKRTWQYNEDSQEIATVSPRGNVEGGEPSKYTTKIERDAQGRALTVTDPLGHTTKYTYDPDGNVETQTDPNGHKKTYTYNADNERTKVEEPSGTLTETGYDGAGQVISETDGNKHATTYTRNVLEQVVESVDPKGRKTVKEYDAAGNLKKLTDAAKRVTSFAYNPVNLLIESSYSDGTTHAIKYEYNGEGAHTHISDGSGETNYTYDQLDRMTESKDGHGNVVKYEYDLANELTKVTYPNGKAVTRAYDKDGRLGTVTDWLGHATKFTYDTDSDLTATTFPSGTSDADTYVYDEADQMREVKMAKGAETLASLVYTRDNDGQLKSATSKSLPGEEKPSYEYDADNRLVKAGVTGYEYDSGNDPTKIGSNTYTYDTAKELESGGGFKYTYNEMGQRSKLVPTTGAATTYTYDQPGNLIAIERPKEGKTAALVDTFTYDGNGLRVSQTISGTKTFLTWQMNEELPLILNDGTNSYIYGPGGFPVEQISSTEKVQYLHHDQAGSTRLITGSTGTIEGAYTYTPYGSVESHTGTATTPLGYDSQYTNSDTGLIYLRARVYDPGSAQFLSVDPLAELTGAPFTYAGDNPLNISDRSGLCNANPFSESFWTEGNCISESPLNPIPYYEKEIESYENGCGYFASVAHGIEGAILGTASLIPVDDAELRVAAWLQTKFPWLSRQATDWIAKDSVAKWGQPNWPAFIKNVLEHIVR